MSGDLLDIDATTPVIAEVITLRPDGVFVRVEEREDGDVYWIERRRGTRSTAIVSYDLAELRQLKVALERVPT